MLAKPWGLADCKFFISALVGRQIAADEVANLQAIVNLRPSGYGRVLVLGVGPPG